MKVFIGADHRGWELKEKLESWLHDEGYEVDDVGAVEKKEGDDYVDYGLRVGSKVVQGEGLGVLLCGSGVGVDMTANKIIGVRSGLGINSDQVREAKQADNINVLALAADFISEEEAKQMVKVFLETAFEGEERHVRRLDKLAFAEIEQRMGGCGGCGGDCGCK